MELGFQHTTKVQATDAIQAVIDFVAHPSHVKRIYPVLSELVCNVYNHALNDPKKDISWSIYLKLLEDSIEFSIEDEGQGFLKSLQREYSYLETSKEAISKALMASYNGEGSRGRGLGLLQRDESLGNVLYYSINSLEGQFDSDNKIPSESDIYISGTKISVTFDTKGLLDE